MNIYPFGDFQNEFTIIHNSVFDIIMRRLDPAPFKVLMTVIRKTRGFHKDFDNISLGQLSDCTGLSEQGVLNSVKKLGGMISCVRNGRTPALYGINRTWLIPAEWVNSVEKQVNSVDLSGVNSVDLGGSTQLTGGVNSVDTQKKLLKKQKRKKDPDPEVFELFWNLYPKKTAKEAAKKAWSKVNSSDHELIFSALKTQSNSHTWLKDNGNFIPYPATWLNGKRWEDQIEPAGHAENGIQFDADGDPTHLKMFGKHIKGRQVGNKKAAAV